MNQEKNLKLHFTVDQGSFLCVYGLYGTPGLQNLGLNDTVFHSVFEIADIKYLNRHFCFDNPANEL